VGFLWLWLFALASCFGFLLWLSFLSLFYGVCLCLFFFLVFFCPSGFFLLSVVVVVLSVLFGSVVLCLFGVVVLLCLRFRCLTLGSCVASSGVNLPFTFLWGLSMSSFLRSILLFPLAVVGSVSWRLGSGPPGGFWDCCYESHPSLCVQSPFGPVTVVGLSFRQRLSLWSEILDCLLYQASSWHWFRVAWSASAREFVVCFFRGWRA